jgi:hypothetical protein
VKVGDYLILQKEYQVSPATEKVVSIEEKYLQGGFSPITEDGTIVVDGYVASCYSNPLFQTSEYVTIFGIPIVHRHVYAHMLKSPLRLFCSCISDVPCQVNPDSKAPIGKMPGIILLDTLHRWSVQWGLEDVGEIVVGLIALGFYGIEFATKKMTLVGIIGLPVLLYHVLPPAHAKKE